MNGREIPPIACSGPAWETALAADCLRSPPPVDPTHCNSIHRTYVTCLLAVLSGNDLQRSGKYRAAMNVGRLASARTWNVERRPRPNVFSAPHSAAIG